MDSEGIVEKKGFSKVDAMTVGLRDGECREKGRFGDTVKRFR